ncbi:unnamed protein product [Brassica rapa subsp. trilocularis]
MVSANLLEIWYFIFVSSKIERSSVFAGGTQNPAIEELEESLEFLITHVRNKEDLHAFLPPRLRRRNDLTACMIKFFVSFFLQVMSKQQYLLYYYQKWFWDLTTFKLTIKSTKLIILYPTIIGQYGILPNTRFFLITISIFVCLVTNSLRCGAICISCIARVIFSFSV